MEKLIIIGAGGFGREVAWLVERINAKNNEWELLGFIDDNSSAQNEVLNGYPILGTTDEIALYEDAYYVCAIGSSKTREKVVEKITDNNMKFATLIDPSVEMSDTVDVGEGTIICAHSILTVNISIGKHVIINLDCTVGHDSIIEDYATLHPSVNLSGTTQIGTASELGTGMQMIQGKKIGSHTVIGAGAVVIDDIPSHVTAVGSPARIIKKD